MWNDYYLKNEVKFDVGIYMRNAPINEWLVTEVGRVNYFTLIVHFCHRATWNISLACLISESLYMLVDRPLTWSWTNAYIIVLLLLLALVAMAAFSVPTVSPILEASCLPLWACLTRWVICVAYLSYLAIWACRTQWWLWSSWYFLACACFTQWMIGVV